LPGDGGGGGGGGVRGRPSGTNAAARQSSLNLSPRSYGYRPRAPEAADGCGGDGGGAATEGGRGAVWDDIIYYYI